MVWHRASDHLKVVCAFRIIGSARSEGSKRASKTALSNQGCIMDVRKTYRRKESLLMEKLWRVTSEGGQSSITEIIRKCAALSMDSA